MRPEDLIVATSARGADASKAFEVPGTGPRRWTIEDAGMACAGMERHVHFAMLYSYAGDESCYFALHAKLTQVAAVSAVIERWHASLHPRLIAGTILSEERWPARFRRVTNRPDPRRLALSLPTHVWRRHGVKAYESVHTEYVGWLGEGAAVMRRWLRISR